MEIKKPRPPCGAGVFDARAGLSHLLPPFPLHGWQYPVLASGACCDKLHSQARRIDVAQKNGRLVDEHAGS
jgi:hypothetical protein